MDEEVGHTEAIKFEFPKHEFDSWTPFVLKNFLRSVKETCRKDHYQVGKYICYLAKLDKFCQDIKTNYDEIGNLIQTDQSFNDFIDASI